MSNFFKFFIILLISFGSLFSCKKRDDDQVMVDLKAENRKVLGSSGEDILSADTFNELRLELVFTNTTRPSNQTINALQDFLNQRVNKPNGIQITQNLIPAPNTQPYSLDEIRDIEDDHRTQYTEDNSIALYIFFANGSSINDTDTSVTLGTAYQNTSIVIYSSTLVQFVGGPNNLSLSTLETITTEHELGHLFSLVNLANDDIHPIDHEDPDNNKHCVIEDCLMYFQSSATRAAIKNRMSRRAQGGTPVFDSLCISDLQAKGGK
jgi:hypothetical protein